MFPRGAISRIATAMADTPVVMVNGPRQCGKTTLVRMIGGAERPYLTLDDDTILAAVRADPAGFIRNLDRATIDEVQHAPELLRAIKRSVDDDRRPGRFLLTGSANILTIPRTADSLAGRMEIITLLPLAQAEIRGGGSAFIDQVFNGRISPPTTVMLGHDLTAALLVGGYPEMLARRDAHRRTAWARDYLRAIIERDVRDVADVGKLEQVPALLRALAHRAGQLANFSSLAADVRLDDKTARRYLGVLEQLFLVRRVEPWFRNPLKRMVKTPKLHFLDSGLLAALTGVTAERIVQDRTLQGPLLETFVLAEILRLSTWNDRPLTLHHYRDKDQDEVDIILEDHAGVIVGIEVKASATVRSTDFKGLRKIAAAGGDAFKLGLVLYDGDTLVPFGDRLFAAPISCLWNS